MTPNEYVQNPMGKGSAVIPNTDTKNRMNSEYERVRYKMSVNCYLLDNHLAVYCFLIPSSSSDVVYNVVLQFDLTIANEKGLESVIDLPFQCYSNCPSFVFTYAKVFDNKGLLIPWIRSKYNKNSLKESKVRNAYGIIGYEKSLYIAIRFLLSNPIHKITQFKIQAKMIKSPREIKSIITNFDMIMEQYHSSQKKKEEPNKHQLIAEKAEIDTIRRRDDAMHSQVVQSTKKISKVKSIHKI